MKRYTVCDREQQCATLEVTGELDTCLETRLIRAFGDRYEIIEQTMSRDLFTLCLRTGYLKEVPLASFEVA